MTELTLSTICGACQSIFTAETLRNEAGEVAHHGLETLTERAGRDCHLCLTVYLSIDPDTYKNFRRGATTDSRSFVQLSPIAR